MDVLQGTEVKQGNDKPKITEDYGPLQPNGPSEDLDLRTTGPRDTQDQLITRDPTVF